MPTNLPYRPCVGLMLLNPEGKIFCGERHNMPGAWQMPQGGVQGNEALETAALRELKEEIGVSTATIIAKAQQTHCYDFPNYLMGRKIYQGKYRGQEQTWFALRFTGADSEIDLIAHNDHEGPEFSQWRWMSATEVLKSIVAFKRPVYQAVLDEFAHLVQRD